MSHTFAQGDMFLHYVEQWLSFELLLFVTLLSKILSTKCVLFHKIVYNTYSVISRLRNTSVELLLRGLLSIF